MESIFVNHRRQNSVCRTDHSQQRTIKSRRTRLAGDSVSTKCLAGYDITNSKYNKHAQNSFVVPNATERDDTGGMTVLVARSHNAFQITGDSGAAQAWARRHPS